MALAALSLNTRGVPHTSTAASTYPGRSWQQQAERHSFRAKLEKHIQGTLPSKSTDRNSNNDERGATACAQSHWETQRYTVCANTGQDLRELIFFQHAAAIWAHTHHCKCG